ncbi:ABC transporter ATP-binding protein [Xanthobacteraceae bacterium Astr-EGSB]|uniref:ABC transporter ATP-binding protein n=1 Tax=Astrobacterium formosum TaxID=3069710 RepID=UPI0027B67EDF|nr:ABC transporter ATP-binding protein [Xanthobacteraceae bacterium Astr-EGSB]
MSRPCEPLLSVEGLTIKFHTGAGTTTAIDDLSFEVRRGEVVCLVGESGSGKSVTGLSILRLIDPPGDVAGRVLFAGRDLLTESEADMTAVRGRDISMIFQEPMTALNPAMRVGDQIVEVLRIHEQVTPENAMARAIALLDRVGIQDAAVRARAYPHELSGGMRQRVMIAIACAAKPKLIIADEPTTALDVTVQAQVLDLLFDMQAELGSAMLFITHDLGVVAEIADHVVVMYRGRIVEQGPVEQILRAPRHAYTEALVASAPDVDAPRVPGRRFPTIDVTESADGDLPVIRSVRPEPVTRRAAEPAPAGETVPLVEIDKLHREFILRYSWAGRPTDVVRAVRGVDLAIWPGSTVALVGESGSGKSTLGRCVAHLDTPTAGSIRFDGRNVSALDGAQLKRFRRDVQTIFQDPYASLNPRRRIGQSISDGLAIHGLMSATERRDFVADLLRRVGLRPEFVDRYPHEFSGGQRQRIAIARALALSPRFVIADEAVSALDMSVRAQVLNLLADLQEEFGLTFLFISHDLSTVRQFSDRIAIMRRGEIVEEGETEEIFEDPKHEYTRALLKAVPRIKPGRNAYRGKGRKPSSATMNE